MVIKHCVSVDPTFGKYVLRVNGHYVGEFWRKSKAYEFAFRLNRVLEIYEMETENK